MSINIGYDFKNNKPIVESDFTRERTKNNDEIELLNKIATDLGIVNYEIVNNSDNYTTLKYKEYDLVRLKYTTRTKWISIFLSKEERNSNIDNPLFDAQKNKNQLFWKSTINQDIDIYYPFIEKYYKEIQ